MDGWSGPGINFFRFTDCDAAALGIVDWGVWYVNNFTLSAAPIMDFIYADCLPELWKAFVQGKMSPRNIHCTVESMATGLLVVMVRNLE